MNRSETHLLKALSDNDGAVYAREITGRDVETMRLLCARGYAARQGALEIAAYVITDLGKIALSDDAVLKNERRWTRGLAIAAIIISLLTLMLELDDRGMLGGLFDGFKTTRSDHLSSTPTPPEKSAEQ